MFKKEYDLMTKISDQIQSMENQRDNLLDDLEKAKTFEEKYKLRKLASDIDNKLIQLFSKMISYGKTSLEPTEKPDEVNENEIKQLVRELVLENKEPYEYDVYSDDEIKYEFIRRKKCDIKNTESVFKRMLELGLSLCPGKKLKPSHDYVQTFDVAKFALMRGYLSKNELASVENSRQKKRDEIDEFESQRRDKFKKKYGPDMQKWPEDVLSDYRNYEDADKSSCTV